MITSTSSSRSDLNSIQTLMPLTVRVKGAKRIHERLSATWEDAVRRASRQEVALLLSMKKKNFPETNKTVCADKLDNLASVEWRLLMLLLERYLLKRALLASVLPL